jgi:hypothetical protein
MVVGGETNPMGLWEGVGDVPAAIDPGGAVPERT